MGHGWEGGGGKFRRGGRETQTGDQGLTVISGSQFIDKLVGQTKKGEYKNCVRQSYRN